MKYTAVTNRIKELIINFFKKEKQSMVELFLEPDLVVLEPDPYRKFFEYRIPGSRRSDYGRTSVRMAIAEQPQHLENPVLILLW